jgi:hypothetical protein
MTCRSAASVAKWKRASSLGQSIPATIGVDAERDRLDSVAHRLAGHAPLDLSVNGI